MKKLNATLVILALAALSFNTWAQECIYESTMEDPTKLFNRNDGFGGVHGGEDYSDLGHWLGWVHNAKSIVCADGVDGFAWGFEEIDPITGEKSIKADILDLGTGVYPDVSALTVFPLIDYTKDHMLSFKAKVDGDWDIRVRLQDSYRNVNASPTIWTQDTVVLDGESIVSFIIPADTMQAKLAETTPPTEFAFHGTRIEIMIGTRTGKFILDEVCLKEYSGVGLMKSSVSLISLFPNPVTSNLTVENLKDATSLEILNTLGQVIARTKVDNSKSMIVSTESLAPGVYIIRSKNNQRVIGSSKFVKK